MDTKRIIADATMTLLESSTIDKITISDILARAHVSRSTFYRYFVDKYDVIIWHLECATDELMQCAGENQWYDMHHAFDQFTAENAPLLRTLLRYDKQDSYWHYVENKMFQLLSRACSQGVRDDAKLSLAITFTASGLSHCLREWLLSGCKLPVESFSAYTYELIPDCLRQYI